MSLVYTEVSKREGMIELQDPQSIKVSGATQQLLDQITESMQPINAQRPFPPEIADRLKDALMPDRVVASLNMEGIVATRRQTIAVMHAMRINESINRGEREIYNTLRADEFVHQAVEDGIALDERFIRELNKLLLTELRQDAGAFRAGPVELPGAPYPPPDAGDVPALVQRLCELFPRGESLHPVLHAAWLHAQFTQIHPFSDGNGRGGRLLQDWALIRRGLLPVGIPPSQRDDYYATLEKADQGDFDDFVELISLLELSLIAKTEALLEESERHASFIQRLANAASRKDKDTRHKKYLVWRTRMETLAQTFAGACRELDRASDVIGAAFKDYGVVEFREWERICKQGYISKSWLFSILFFAEGHPFYKTIAYVRRHKPIPAVDPFEPPRDAVALYFTGTAIPDGPEPNFSRYEDPHVRLREVLFLDDEGQVYVQESPDAEWKISEFKTPTELVEQLFLDVFNRKAGLDA
jgi:Fic family protein